MSDGNRSGADLFYVPFIVGGIVIYQNWPKLMIAIGRFFEFMKPVFYGAAALGALYLLYRLFEQFENKQIELRKWRESIDKKIEEFESDSEHFTYRLNELNARPCSFHDEIIYVLKFVKEQEAKMKPKAPTTQAAAQEICGDTPTKIVEL